LAILILQAQNQSLIITSSLHTLGLPYLDEDNTRYSTFDFTITFSYTHTASWHKSINTL